MSKLAPFADEIETLMAAGWNDVQVGDHLLIEHGVDVTASAICYYRQRRGIPSQRGRPAKLSPAEAARMQDRRRAGATLDDIAAAFGVCRQTVAKHLRLLDLPAGEHHATPAGGFSGQP